MTTEFSVLPRKKYTAAVARKEIVGEQERDANHKIVAKTRVREYNHYERDVVGACLGNFIKGRRENTLFRVVSIIYIQGVTFVREKVYETLYCRWNLNVENYNFTTLWSLEKPNVNLKNI